MVFGRSRGCRGFVILRLFSGCGLRILRGSGGRRMVERCWILFDWTGLVYTSNNSVLFETLFALKSNPLYYIASTLDRHKALASHAPL